MTQAKPLKPSVPTLDNAAPSARMTTASPTVEWLGVLGLCMLAFFAMVSVSRANVGLILMAILAAGFLRTDLKPLLRDRMSLLTGLFIAYLGIWTLLAIIADPAASAQVIDSVESWPITGFLGLVLAGFWLSRGRVRPEILLLLLLGGLVVRVLMRLEWDQLDTQIATFIDGSRRATFGYSSVNLGIWSAIAVIGLVAMWRRFFDLGRPGAGWLFGALCWMVCLVITSAALAFSQTRSAWGAMLLVLPPVILAALYPRLRSRRARVVASLTLLIAGAISLHQLANTDLVHNRVLAQWETVVEAFSGESDNRSAEVIAVRARLAMYRLFWEKWRQRPLFGWGPGSMPAVLDEGDINQYSDDVPFEHFHSSYFSLLFQYGVVGGLLVTAMFWLIFQQLARRRRAGAIDADLFLFLLGGLMLLLITALVNEPLQGANGPYLVSLLGAIAYGRGDRSRPTAPKVDDDSKR